MSELPPEQSSPNILPPGPIPPPVFAAYTRPGQLAPKADPDMLQSLADGYFSLNWVFLFSVIWVIGGEIVLVAVASQSSRQPGSDGLALGLGWIAFLALTVVVIAFASYGSCKKIGFGLGWTPMGCRLAAMLLGINSFFCFGLIGAIILQSMASAEIRKYGVPTRTMGGFKKKEVQAVVESLRKSPEYLAQQAASARPF